jgi:Kef-type K+ transport system membrane component KefB
MHGIIQDITFCVLAAWVFGLVANWLRQPVLLAYLAGGFALGPIGLNWISSHESVATISELGLIFLLFMIGLEIDLKKIASAGRSITLTAGSQILGGVVLGVGFFRLCGFPLGGGKWDALYLGMAAALSSTVIIVKVLYEKQELDTLAGRITLGVLVLQDLAAILFLAVQPNLGNLHASVLFGSFARAGLLIVLALSVSRYLLPPLFRGVARLPELVQVGAIAWCFLVGELAERLHLSREMGALVAGVALSTFPYALDVTAKVTSLRDFFVTLFFVGLGMQIPLPSGSLVAWSLVMIFFVVASRLLTVFVPLYCLGQGLRISLLPGINLSQISEFSLVIITLGVSSKHFGSPDTAGLVSLAFVILAALSTFGMAKSDGLTRWLVGLLKGVGLKDLDAAPAKAPASGHAHPEARILFLGFFRSASSLLEELQQHEPALMAQIAVVDFSPAARVGLLAREVPIIYGDISQHDTLLHAGIEKAEVLVSTVPDSLLKGINNERLVRILRLRNPDAKIIVTAETLDAARACYAAGADYVSLPRLREAGDLMEAIRAATENLLDCKSEAGRKELDGRSEVLG